MHRKSVRLSVFRSGEIGRLTCLDTDLLVCEYGDVSFFISSCLVLKDRECKQSADGITTSLVS